ncbi:hypothetical protein G6F37_008273 [Rhizopus arrhizus]|nr:hypothetical protein G6F38_006678 [Rhizopus arrhizus]KAG1155728.1 hypothetical protein G6F37_008273 [Rhizopus arrhizus]
MSSPAIKKTTTESKRAEQNRAAQRAFRQRKERYVKELEAKVHSMADWPARMERLEKENQQLREYIAQLESGQQEERLEKTKGLDTLDDLMSILKTHHRPPIPSRPSHP